MPCGCCCASPPEFHQQKGLSVFETLQLYAHESVSVISSILCMTTHMHTKNKLHMRSQQVHVMCAAHVTGCHGRCIMLSYSWLEYYVVI